MEIIRIPKLHSHFTSEELSLIKRWTKGYVHNHEVIKLTQLPDCNFDDINRFPMLVLPKFCINKQVYIKYNYNFLRLYFVDGRLIKLLRKKRLISKDFKYLWYIQDTYVPHNDVRWIGLTALLSHGNSRYVSIGEWWELPYAGGWFMLDHKELNQ